MSIVYIVMNDTLCSFTGATKAQLAANRAIRFRNINTDFLSHWSRYPEPSMRWSGFEPYLLSAPSVRTPFSYT